MADTVVVIAAAEFTPNPVGAGSPTTLRLSVLEVTQTPQTELRYSGESYSGEV